jgi:signal transduction histidine kinase/ligand-binding sensor domain-containing protein/DNA-binding LytR/AlgR family response regulator
MFALARILFLILFCLSSITPLIGSNIAGPKIQGIGFFTTYTSDNGLALDVILCSHCDRSGNLWFGTGGGSVSFFDGKSFTNFTTAQGLAGNIVFCITEDKAGNLWFGTSDGGVTRYNGRSFSTYTTAQGLAGNNVSGIVEDSQGNLWFATHGGGVSKYDGKSFTNYTTINGLVHNNLSSILVDQTGNLWFGTSGGVSRYDGKVFTNFTSSQGLANNNVLSIAQDKAGNLWFGTDGGGASCFNGKSFTSFTMADGLADNTVWSITPAEIGGLWFGTGGGISSYDGRLFTSYTDAQGLANNSVRSITQDKTGNLWFCTYGGGVSHFDGQSFTNFTANQGLPRNSVRSIISDQSGNLWFGTRGGGVARYDGNSFTNFTTATGLAYNSVYSIAEDHSGNLWFGTYGGGASRYNGKSFVNYTTDQGLASNNVVSIFLDSTGNIWFGTFGGGISRFNGQTFTNYTVNQGLAHNSVWSIQDDKSGNLWFGTVGGGVSRFDGKNFTNFTTAQGLADNTVWCITFDRSGNLWLGTYGGISILPAAELIKVGKESVSSNRSLFRNFTTRDGLPNNCVTQILQTRDGAVYAGTNMGICEIILTNDGQFRVVDVYNTSTGYPVKDVNVGNKAMYEDNRGIIWIGTGSDKTALVRFDPKKVHRSDKPSTPVLQGIKVDNENICWNNLKSTGYRLAVINEEHLTFGRELTDKERVAMYSKFGDIRFDSINRFFPLPENLVLPHAHNTIAFEFNAIEPTRHFMVRYQYMLQGYDKDWNLVTNKSSATYGNISKGKYTFLLKACSPDGVWSDPVKYTFKVLPPWYLSIIALIIWGLLSVGSVALWIRFRLAQVNRRNGMITRELELRIKERTAQLEAANKAKSEFLANMSHEIRTPMNAVLGYADLLALSAKDQVQKDYIDSLKSSGRGLLTLINGILDLSKIEAGKLELDFDYVNTKSFFLEFERIFSMKIAEKGLGFTLSIASGTPAGLYVDENRLRQVMFNLIGNAIKFTEKGQIKVTVLTKNPQFVNHADFEKEGFVDLVIEIEDSGIGVSWEFQKEIFNPFTQQAGRQNYGGTGLGLAISKRLITLMKGTINLKSELNQGSIFQIVIPKVAFLRDFERSRSEIHINTQDIVFGKAIIIVADDIISNRKYLVDALKGTNITIKEAEDGQRAFILAQEIIPDLIITDILMPGLDGFQLLDKLKRNDKLKHIPVVAYSASVMIEERDKIKKSEFAGLLIKPVPVTELFLELMNHLPYESLETERTETAGEGINIIQGIVDLPGLIQLLESSFMDTWKKFLVRQPINEIREFGKNLILLGTEHKATFITKYGGELVSSADSFNIEAMLKLIRRYPGIIDDLKNSAQ